MKIYTRDKIKKYFSLDSSYNNIKEVKKRLYEIKKMDKKFGLTTTTRVAMQNEKFFLVYTYTKMRR